MIRTKMLSYGWLILISIILLQIALPVVADAMPAANQKYVKGGANSQPVSTPTKIVPSKITCQIKEGDTFITILTSQGVSMADALYASKKADKKIIKRIRPGGKIDLRMKPGKPSIIEIGYSSPSSKRKIIYSGKAISINPSTVGAALKATSENNTKTSVPFEQAKENVVSIPGMNPEELSENILAAADSTYCSVFNAPQDVQAKIKKETQDMNKQILKIKNEKKNNLRLASIKHHNSKMLASRKVKENARYAYSQKRRSSILSAYEDESESDIYEDDTNDEVTNDNPELREKLINVADTYKGVPIKEAEPQVLLLIAAALPCRFIGIWDSIFPDPAGNNSMSVHPRKRMRLKREIWYSFRPIPPIGKLKSEAKKIPIRRSSNT